MKKVNQNQQQSLTGKQSGNGKRQQSVLAGSRLLDNESSVQKTDTDAALIEEYRFNNNEQAFNELYRRHKQNMLAYLYGILGSWEDAKDVLQDAWECALLAFSNASYNEEQDFAGWFKSVCYHKADKYKQERRKFYYGNNSVPDHADAAYTIEEILGNKQDEHLLQLSLDKLTETERQIVLLRIYSNKSFYEIAVMRDINVHSATGIYSRALKKLKKAIA